MTINVGAGQALPPEPRARDRRRAFVGASVGNAVEWYDFAAYGFVAVYIGANFFPSGDRTVELLSSFAVFGLTFLARPLGGMLFGPLGDRIGRKRVMVIVLVLMAVATTAIGLLPTYEAIGVAAPALLVVIRCLQGLSAGGEYGSVSTFMVEYAGRGRRAFGSSWMMFTAVIGFMLGSAVATGLAAVVGTDAMTEWAWRVPFLLAAPMGAVTLYIRLKLEDTPEFRAMRANDGLSRQPLREVFGHRRGLLLTCAVGALHATAFYMVFTYLSTYVGTVLERGSSLAFTSTFIAGTVALVTLPFAAMLSDRRGRRFVLLPAAVAIVLLAYPLFLLISSSGPVGVVIGHATFAFLLACFISTSVTTMAELFPARVRSSGVSVGYNLPAALVGGTAPFVATLLVAQTGNVHAPAFYLMAVAAVAVVAMLVLRPSDLHGDPVTENPAERTGAGR